MSDFEKCTTKKVSKCGLVDIECKLGLWGVSASCAEDAMREAIHYFNQYKADGEYSSIIGGKSTRDILMGRAYKGDL